MDWSDVINTIKKIAPTAEGLLATFGGVPGMIASGAIKAITEVFGLTDKATPDDILKAISTDPQAALKLALAEQDFQVKMRESDIEELKAQLVDVQSARQRQVEHEKITGKSDRNLYVLAWTLVVGFFLLTGGLLYFSYIGKPISDSTGVLFMLMGTMATAFGGVIQYFFGSSKSSNDKTELLAKAQPIT